MRKFRCYRLGDIVGPIVRGAILYTYPGQFATESTEPEVVFIHKAAYEKEAQRIFGSEAKVVLVLTDFSISKDSSRGTRERFEPDRIVDLSEGLQEIKKEIHKVLDD